MNNCRTAHFGPVLRDGGAWHCTDCGQAVSDAQARQTIDMARRRFELRTTALEPPPTNSVDDDIRDCF